MTPDLRQFLQEWLTWAEAGGGQPSIFYEQYGLCGNLGTWAFSTERDQYTLFVEFYDLLDKEFPEDYSFPFGGESVYNRAKKTCTQHLNEDRRAWVRAQLAK